MSTEPFQTVAELVEARANDTNPALKFEGRVWTWAEVVAESRRRAAMLEESRVDGPFHIGVLLDNVPEYVFLLAGAALAGAVVVGINPTRRGGELARDIRHTDCQLIVTDSEHRPLLEDLDLGVSPERIWESDQPDWESSLRDASGADPAESPRPGDLYLLLFTSGSSGAPKAVRMTQGRAARAANSMLCTQHDVPYCAMPLFHGNALNANLFPALSSGATIALRRRFSASSFLDDVREHGGTYFSSIGRVLNYILATPERPDDADNPLKFVLGPESSAADMIEFERRFGCPVFSGYGSSENAIILTPAPNVSKSALGVALEDQDIAVVNADTEAECPPARFDADGRLTNASEAIGELVGRNVADNFEGYYNNEDAAAERMRNGWYWSGDLAYRDTDGVFWFAGRTADWIRVDGENFSSAPIERILARFPGIEGIAVYGVPDERNAEDQVMACIEPSRSVEFDPASFETFLGDQADLGTKWAPRFIRVMSSLPTTGTNKIDKKPLRADAWSTDDDVWWRADPRRSGYRLLTDAETADINRTVEASGHVRNP